MRNRTRRIADDLEAAVPSPSAPDPDPAIDIAMAIDGAHIRAAHGYQSRHIDVTVGKIEVIGRPPRRFALAPKGAIAPLATLREALREQGWRPSRALTVLSDGESALQSLVRAEIGEPITCILDWWHISMRVRHIEQALREVYALEPQHRAGLEIVEWRVSRLRHLIWNGHHEEAQRELFGMHHMASEVVYLNGEAFRSAIGGLLWNCDDLRRYLANNVDALINYGARYRSRLPISTSRAEGCVDEIANARMARSGVCDGRLAARTASQQFALLCWAGDSKRRRIGDERPERPDSLHSRRSTAVRARLRKPLRSSNPRRGGRPPNWSHHFEADHARVVPIKSRAPATSGAATN